MSEDRIDESWLNDRSEFQENFISGQRSPHGLRLWYRLERDAERGPLVVTARMEVRYRSASPLGDALRFEAWATRHRRMSMHAEARALLRDGTVVAESSGTFLPLTPELERQMVKRWPGFAEFLNRELP